MPFSFLTRCLGEMGMLEGLLYIYIISPSLNRISCKIVFPNEMLRKQECHFSAQLSKQAELIP